MLFLVATPTGDAAKLNVSRSRNMWLYSTPIDQLGAKPNSRPAPTVAPQVVSFDELINTFVAVKV